MTENNISDRGGLESRYTADAIDVIISWHPKLAELYEAEADKKRLLDKFLATFDDENNLFTSLLCAADTP